MSRESEVVLLTPPCDGHDSASDLGLALGALHAALERAGFSTSACRVGDNVAGLPVSPATKLVGLSVLFTAQVPLAFRLAEAVRELTRDIHITIGGQGTSFVWERILRDCPTIDSTTCFEADETIVDLANSILDGSPLDDVKGIYHRSHSGDITFTGYRDPPTDLDSLPLPSRTKGDFVLGQPHFALLSSRGCSAHCTFCQSGNYGNKYHAQPRWRPRSAHNIIAEMVQLSESFGVNVFSFVDDDFLGACSDGPPRAQAFAEGLLAIGPRHQFSWSIECRVDEISSDLFSLMRRAGLKHVFMGVESGNEQDLRLFGKRTQLVRATQAIAALRALGVEVTIGFINFQPFSTSAELAENIAFLRDNRVASVARLTNYLQLYPGSPLIRPFGNRGVSMSEQGYEVTYEYVDPETARYVADRQRRRLSDASARRDTAG